MSVASEYLSVDINQPFCSSRITLSEPGIKQYNHNSISEDKLLKSLPKKLLSSLPTLKHTSFRRKKNQTKHIPHLKPHQSTIASKTASKTAPINMSLIKKYSTTHGSFIKFHNYAGKIEKAYTSQINETIFKKQHGYSPPCIVRNTVYCLHTH